MRITTKGQVTIPKEIRESMGLLPHTEIEFVTRRGNVYLKKKAEGDTKRGRDLIKSMRSKATVKMTTDEIMALTRKAS